MRRSPLRIFVLFSLLWLAFLPESRTSTDPPPPVLSGSTDPVSWQRLADTLKDQRAWYEWSSKLPPPTTKAKKPATPRASGFSGEDVWAALARCESGGTNASTGNGFYGYFQFVPSTWRSLGYGGLPTDFDYGTQRDAAMHLQARSGWSQWPACARRLGLI